MVPQLAHLAVEQLPIGSQLVPSAEPQSQSQDALQVMQSMELLHAQHAQVPKSQLAQSAVPPSHQQHVIQVMVSKPTLHQIVSHALQLSPVAQVTMPMLSHAQPQLPLPQSSQSLHAKHYTDSTLVFAQHATQLQLPILPVALSVLDQQLLLQSALQAISIPEQPPLQFAQHAAQVAGHAPQHLHALHAIQLDIILPVLLAQLAQQVLQHAQLPQT
jgi:hypothetical protein